MNSKFLHSNGISAQAQVPLTTWCLTKVYLVHVHK